MRLLILILAVIAVHSAKLRIMSLGDSLAVGQGLVGGYRRYLYQNLQHNGYDVEFVGSSTDNTFIQMPIVDRHEGHASWNINKFIEFSPEIFENAGDLDVILLMVGADDMIEGDYADAINRWDNLLLKIASIQPSAQIIVSNILLFKSNDTVNKRIENFNVHASARVQKHRIAGRKVEFTNAAAKFNSSELQDWKHLNSDGYKRMGNIWAQAIKRKFSPNGDSYPPQVIHAKGSTDGKLIILTFSKPLSDDSSNIANFAVKDGVQIINATLDDEQRTITLHIVYQDDVNGGAGWNTTFGPDQVTIIGGVTDRTDTKLPVRAGTQIGYTNSWRFIVLSDWHSAEKYVFNKNEALVNQDIKTVEYLHHNYGGEFVMIPGDTNSGQWTKERFQRDFQKAIGNENMTAKEIVLAAGSRCYGGMLRSFRLGGYAKVLLSQGDHEAGDNPCKFFIEYF